MDNKLTMKLSFLVATAVLLTGMWYVQTIDMSCGPQLPNPQPDHLGLAVECSSTDLIATQPNGELYVLTHPIQMRASILHWPAGQWGFVPDGWSSSSPLTQTESYIRLPIDFGGLMKHFRLAVVENTLNGPAHVWVRHNGWTITDTLTNQPVQITVPAGAVGGQSFDCCRSGRINININRGDQLYFYVDTSGASSGTISAYWVLSL